MDLGLKGKNALITGGSHGIGLAIAKALAEEGCNVGICAREEENVKIADLELRSFGVRTFSSASVDVLDPESIKIYFKEVINRWGTIHILVNNVGGGGRWGSIFNDTPEQVWTDVYNKNAMAAVRFTKLVLPLMEKQGWGRVVTIASMFGKEGGGAPWFNMAKAAEISLMKSLAMSHYSRYGITFNSVAPGYISIPGNNNDFPSKNVGSAEDVAAAVAFLCSEQAKFINGATLSIDGGESRSF